MFKVEKKDTVKWPVTVYVPKDGGGFHPGREFKATFKLLPQSQLNDALDKLNKDDADLLRDLLVGWDDVRDSEDQPMPFNEENRDALIDMSYVRTALIKSYFAMASGNKAALKNL